MPSPEAICMRVRAALEHEPRINLHRYPVHLHCEDGVVTVEGEAEHIDAKKLALETEEEVADAVRLVLGKDPFVRADQIRVHTWDRIVTLEGIVPNTTICELAGRDVWYVLGVDRVVNRLQVAA